MKIKELAMAPPSRAFVDLDDGAVFSCDGELYIKTDEDSGVVLKNGVLRDFLDNTRVVIVNGTFVVE